MSTIATIHLRLVNINDAEILLDWHNDAITRQYSHSSDLVSAEQHYRWLQSVMNDPARTLYIAEKNGIPIGTVRADLIDGVHILSWTVSPHARGYGLAKQVVKQLLDKTPLPVKAQIKRSNLASIAVAKSNGLRFDSQQGDYQYYVLP